VQGQALSSEAHRDTQRRHLSARTRAPRVNLACLVALLTLTFGPSARAQQPASCDASRPVIELDVQPAALTPLAGEHLYTELRGAVARWGLNLCTQALATGAPLAQVRIIANGPHRIGISARDLATQKVVMRDVDLSDLPPDVHGEAIALAVEELLKASWLELALADDATAPVPHEAQQLRVEVSKQLARPQVTPLSIGVRGAFDVYSGGAMLTGADLLLTGHARRPLGAQVSAGARQGVTHNATHGRIELRALTSDLAVFVRAWTNDSFTLLFPLAVSLSWVTFTGIADAGDIGRSRTGLALAVSWTANGVVHLGRRASLLLAIGPGRVLRGVAAKDQGRTAIALSGWTAQAQLGVAVRL